MISAKLRGTLIAAAIALALAATLLASVVPGAPPGFRDASAPWVFKFPRDHASHPEFQTEWWYYTGHLDSGARHFGFELTFFRVGLSRDTTRGSAWAMRDLIFAHAALTDESGHRFLFADTLVRPVLGRAGADTARYRVWIDDWSASLAEGGATHALRADGGRFALDLALAPGKPPVAHGANGVSRKSAKAAESSHYVSLTRMPARGRVRLDGAWFDVTGSGWMDHEFLTTPLRTGAEGWDWFALQMEDGRELMLYQLRLPGGKIEPFSSGTWIEPDGASRALALADFTITPAGTWKSPASNARYPAGWTIAIPGEGFAAELTPTVADQELRTRGLTAVTYWEGSVDVRATRRGVRTAGRGYVELTGYAGRAPGR